ncbi:MAG: putative nicotinate-nucleotide adenylyltransferase [Chlamydiae bacterium]|nr:putative nicotinate-nucleotide adenylyltransferase [Chlamydiota bacterium]
MENHLVRRKVGFFGGTFDPIHFGHLNLALQILEIHKLDQIFFSPANFSPEKGESPPTAPKKARKEMVELAIEEIPEFTVIDIELEREGPSYTIDTIKLLQKQMPEVEFYLILGEDILKGLPRWKDVEKLLEMAPPLVGGRHKADSPDLPELIQKKIHKGRTPIPSMEISSTELRTLLHQKKYCGQWIPAKVLDYIHKHKLY